MLTMQESVIMSARRRLQTNLAATCFTRPRDLWIFIYFQRSLCCASKLLRSIMNQCQIAPNDQNWLRELLRAKNWQWPARTWNGSSGEVNWRLKNLVTIYRQQFQSIDPILPDSEMLVLLLCNLCEATTRKGTAKHTRNGVLSLGINFQRRKREKIKASQL